MHISKVIDATLLALEPEQTSGMLADVLSHVHDLRDYYPEFESWIAGKVIPGLHAGERSILVEYRAGKLAALAIVKDDSTEKKLCCLRVLPGYENAYGLGIRLFEKSFDVLQTEKPLLSVAEERLPAFAKIFTYFRFELATEYVNRYRSKKIEYAFNGLLDLPASKIYSPQKNLSALVR